MPPAHTELDSSYRPPISLPLGLDSDVVSAPVLSVAQTQGSDFVDPSLLCSLKNDDTIGGGTDFIIKSMQLLIERYIELPQEEELPTGAVIFADIVNMFSSVSSKEYC